MSLCKIYNKTKYGIKCVTADINIEIIFYTTSIVKVLKYPIKTKGNYNSFSIIRAPKYTPLKVQEINNEIILKSEDLQVTLNKDTGVIKFYDSKKNCLLSEYSNGTKFTPVCYNNFSTYITRQSFKLSSNELIYGLGQHQNGKMNQRNQILYLRQENTDIAIPFFQSIKGYGVFWDNTSYTKFIDNNVETSFESEAGNCINYYFIYGRNADKVISQMRYLTGKVPMYPLWAFGFWQSRERYKGQDELVNVVKKYREMNIPLDCIVQDWQYWGTDNSYWNAINFNNPNYYNAKKMVEDIHNLDAHIAISIWPSFGIKTDLYNNFKKNNMILNLNGWPKGALLYDPFNPKARDIYWNAIEKNLLSIGIDGWWLDATEPELTQKDYYKINQKTYAGQYQYVANAFPIATVGGVYEHNRQKTSDKRICILTRSAFAGQQRYGATSWSGDIISSWDVFEKQISSGINFSLCGIPYWNTDIGGFKSCINYPKGVKDPNFQELYVRWNQFATFNPMMRSHGTCTPREIYQFGNKGTWAFDSIEKYIRLRYKLLPYIYSTAWSVTNNNNTFIRGLIMDFPNDKNVHDLGNEFMFGNSILVAPVTSPMYIKNNIAEFSNIGIKNIYLPNNVDWFDFWTGEKIKGGNTIKKEVPIDIMPIYIKEGSIIPFGPDVQYASEKPWDELEIRIYPGANGEFILYEDEFDNYNYEKGYYTTISFKWNDFNQTLTINRREGKYRGMHNKRKFKIIKVSNEKGFGSELCNKVDTIITYKGDKTSIRIN